MQTLPFHLLPQQPFVLELDQKPAREKDVLKHIKIPQIEKQRIRKINGLDAMNNVIINYTLQYYLTK